MTEVLAILFLTLAVVFDVMGLLGVLVFPDVYTRLQASATCTTTAVLSVLIAAMLITGWSPMTGKTLVIALFFIISSPVSAHIIARYAWNRNMVPWRRIGVPQSKQDREEK